MKLTKVDLLFEQKESTRRVLFFESATCLKLIAPSPRSKNLPKNTNAPQVKDWPRWASAWASLFI